jgi:hypothetical protein
MMQVRNTPQWCQEDQLVYNRNAMTFAKLAQQHIVAFVHCKGCAVVFKL